jgi:hypothetical protein
MKIFLDEISFAWKGTSYPLINYFLDEFSFDQKQALSWHQELFVV